MPERIDSQPSRRAVPVVSAVPRRPDQPRRAIDQRQFGEIRGNLGADKLQGLLALAQYELTERPKRIRQLADQEDFAKLRDAAHNFMGAVATVGLAGVARAARAVELAAPGTALALDRLDRESMRGRMAVARLPTELAPGAVVKG